MVNCTEINIFLSYLCVTACAKHGKVQVFCKFYAETHFQATVKEGQMSAMNKNRQSRTACVYCIIYYLME